MKSFDVIVIGAGPAGGQCARECAEVGLKVLLVEKAKDFSVNNFSTAGSLLEMLDTYSLDESVVGTYWDKVCLRSTQEKVLFSSPEPKGVVFDFAKLRTFLAEQLQKSGGELLLGWGYYDHKEVDGKMVVQLKQQKESVVKAFSCDVIVDATGAERKVLNKNYDKKSAFAATGIEYLLEVPEEDYHTWSRTLSFFLGLDWMPQGYGWIFPMEGNLLKVGVGRYFVHDRFVPYEESYRFYLEQLIRRTIVTGESRIVDRHGKTLYYTYRRKDPHYHRNVIAIGDAISCVNPLALEGIRHAMVSARMAAKHIQSYVGGTISDFYPYQEEISRYCGWKWRASELLMHKIYCQPNDRKMDLAIKAFSTLDYQQMINLCFHYNLKEVLKYLFTLFRYQNFPGFSP